MNSTVIIETLFLPPLTAEGPGISKTDSFRQMLALRLGLSQNATKRFSWLYSAILHVTRQLTSTSGLH